MSSVSETGSYHLMFVAEMRLFLLKQQIGDFWQALNSRSYGNIWGLRGGGSCVCVCVRVQRGDEGACGLGGADVLMAPKWRRE